jgi:mannitol operon repressor
MKESDREWFKAYAVGRDDIWEKDPHYRAFMATLTELHSETDRGVALVVTSCLDKILGDSIASFCIENDSSRALLNGFNAPLGTLSTKIAACHALGIISDDEMRECQILRRVRNAFAHEIEVTFDKGSVKDLCGNLSFPPPEENDNVRGRFVKGSILLLINILNRPFHVAKRRLTAVDWNNQKENLPPAT